MRGIELEVVRRYIGEEGHQRPGNIVRVVENRARFLVEQGLARVRQAPAAGPQEDKQKGPHLGKDSGALTTGPSIGTPSSSAPGPDAAPSSSPADPASAESKPSFAERLGLKGRRSRRSRSTTPTE